MIIEQATEIAQKFLDKKNIENPYKSRLKFVLATPKLFDEGWYFKNQFELLNPDEAFAMGGAPGFVVSKKDGSVEDISWEKYNLIKENLR